MKAPAAKELKRSDASASSVWDSVQQRAVSSVSQQERMISHPLVSAVILAEKTLRVFGVHVV